MDETGGADETGAELTGAEETGAADEQPADAKGMGTVSVAPASVMRVVVQPHVGIGPPEYETALAALWWMLAPSNTRFYCVIEDLRSQAEKSDGLIHGGKYYCIDVFRLEMCSER